MPFTEQRRHINCKICVHAIINYAKLHFFIETAVEDSTRICLPLTWILWFQAKAQTKAECDKLLEESAKELAVLRQRLPEEEAKARSATQLKEELESVRSDLANRASTIDRLGRSQLSLEDLLVMQISGCVTPVQPGSHNQDCKAFYFVKLHPHDTCFHPILNLWQRKLWRTRRRS